MIDIDIQTAVEERAAERSDLAKGATEAGRRVADLPD